MKLIGYDFEVFAHDWLVVLKDYDTKERFRFHNNSEGLKEFMQEEPAYYGFNTKGYDQFIMRAAVCGATPEEIKVLNDWLIAGNSGWEYPELRNWRFWFNNVDLRDDMQETISLKSIEGHLFMDIHETQVDFNIDRPLTEKEVEMTFFYCEKDVDATEVLLETRMAYLKTKINLASRAGISEVRALGLTNAKLTAKILKAERKEWHDGRDYVYPPNLDLSLIPKEIIDFFETIHDKSIPDEVLFKTSLEITLGNMPCKYAWGGVHGSLLTVYAEADDETVILNVDVSSLYPSLLELYKYLSRNIPDPHIYYDLRKERIQAKHNGNKQLAKDLKLPLNTVSGAQEAKFNDLYDPLPTRSMRISGQLFLTMLTMRLLKDCKTIRLMNYNTDGLMFSIKKSEVDTAMAICSQWEKETGLELETDHIQKVWIKDVNNLLIVMTNGEIKKVGGYLNYGITVKGAWGVNNNATIIPEALEKYFVQGIPVRDTIEQCNDIKRFQLIAKAGSKYSRAYQIVDGIEVDTQKVNRVYATKNERYGKLYKVHGETGRTAKIESLPDHCIIDNSNELSIDSIDKEWYIKLAQKRVNDYLGIKPEKKGKRTMENENKTPETAETTEAPAEKKTRTRKPKVEAAVPAIEVKPMNVYQKLLEARVRFLEAGAKKTGKNMHLQFMYFELEDIVPPATRIFQEVGLIALPNIIGDIATLTIVDIDNPEQTIVFSLPFDKIQPIVSGNTGKQATNAMQALGSSVTYIRRYLYMIALDICEADTFDANVGAPIKVEKPPVGGTVPTTHVPVSAPKAAPAPRANKIPVSSENRQAIASNLANADGPATELQIGQLKAALAELLKKDPSKEETVQKIALKTEGFTKVSKTECENTMRAVALLLKGGAQA